MSAEPTGTCSVPMFCDGLPAGYCDKPAYGERPPSQQFMNYITGRYERTDGRYNGYVPRLACPHHGGPQREDGK